MVSNFELQIIQYYTKSVNSASEVLWNIINSFSTDKRQGQQQGPIFSSSNMIIIGTSTTQDVTGSLKFEFWEF